MIRSPPMRFESEQPPPPPPPPPPSRGAFSVEGHRCVHERCATWPLVKRCTQYSSVKHACATRPFGPVFIVLARYHHLPRRSLHGIQLDPTCLLMFTLRGWGSRWTKNVYRNRFFFFFFKRVGRLFEESRKIDGEELFRSENGKSSQFSFAYKYMVIIKFFQAPFLNSKKLMVDESVITTIISIKLITSRD